MPVHPSSIKHIHLDSDPWPLAALSDSVKVSRTNFRTCASLCAHAIKTITPHLWTSAPSGCPHPHHSHPASAALDADKITAWWMANGGLTIVGHTPESWAIEASMALAAAKAMTEKFKQKVNNTARLRPVIKHGSISNIEHRIRRENTDTVAMVTVNPAHPYTSSGRSSPHAGYMWCGT